MMHFCYIFRFLATLEALSIPAVKSPSPKSVPCALVPPNNYSFHDLHLVMAKITFVRTSGLGCLNSRIRHSLK